MNKQIKVVLTLLTIFWIYWLFISFNQDIKIDTECNKLNWERIYTIDWFMWEIKEYCVYWNKKINTTVLLNF